MEIVSILLCQMNTIVIVLLFVNTYSYGGYPSTSDSIILNWYPKMEFEEPILVSSFDQTWQLKVHHK